MKPEIEARRPSAKPSDTAAATHHRRLLFAVAGATVALLGLLIALFFFAAAGFDLSSPAPVERLTFERFELEPGVIRAYVRNSGPAELTIALARVNDSIWPATADPSNVLPRLGTATVTLRFPWVSGEAYDVSLFTSNALVFKGSVRVAVATPRPTPGTVVNLTLVGLVVGVVPIALGMLWLPALRGAGGRTMLFLQALAAGVLLVLGIDTLAEALDIAPSVPGPFQGRLIVGIGTVGTILALSAVSLTQRSLGADSPLPRWRVALVIALGIGLHNLGEGLAIGSAYAIGEIAFGAFLVIGFILQNFTEGVAIIAPIVRDRPRVLQLVALAALAGVPTIAGAWIGGFTQSKILATLFLAVGAGAILQVLFVVGRAAARDTIEARAPLVGAAGASTGMLLLYGAGLLVK